MGGSLGRQLNTCFEVNSVMTKWTDDSTYDETRGRNSVVTIRDTCAEANSIVGNEARFNEPCDTLTRGYIRTLFIVVAPRALYAACSTSDSVSWRPTRWKQFHRCIFFNGNPEISTGKRPPRKNADFNPLTMDSSDTRMFVLNCASRKPNRSIIFTINFFVSLRQFI